MTRLLHAFAVAAAVCTLPARLASGQVPTHRLASPTGSASEPFTEIKSVVELGDGRVLVADSREHRLVEIDFSRGTGRPIGRKGGGPGEFRLIGRLLPRPDGGAWVVDFGLGRLLPVRSDATFDNPVPFPVSIQLLAADSSGTLYGTAFLQRQPGQARPDSMWILRWSPSGSRVDTLLKYDASVSASVVSRGEAFRPFAPVDAWDALPNGDVMLFDAERYEAQLFRDGRRVRTTSIPWTPIRVTDAEKDAFLRKQEAQRPVAIGQPGATPSAPRPRPPTEFPATLPPFGGKGLGGRYTTVSPAGQVWVERLGAAGDTVPRYDVIDGESGTLVMHVLLPPRSRLVGFGSGAVYVSERDADDWQYLRRHAVPPVQR